MTFPTRPKGPPKSSELGHSSEESPHAFCMPNLEDKKCHSVTLGSNKYVPPKICRKEG